MMIPSKQIDSKLAPLRENLKKKTKINLLEREILLINKRYSKA